MKKDDLGNWELAMRVGLFSMVLMLWGGTVLVSPAVATTTLEETSEERVQSWRECDREVAAFETEDVYINICQRNDGELVGLARSKAGDEEIRFSNVRPLDGNSYCLDGSESTTYLVTPYEVEVWQHNRLVRVDRVLEQY
ncbi:hypothetical protein [Baaleninema sp.]|uniref:hypothetical protein n=1 Tax=Baaleninema sp. TaxID=3101197 RepID=UPI003D068FA1